jgi:hypothetical protein
VAFLVITAAPAEPHLTGHLLARGDYYMTRSDKLVDLLDQRKEIVDAPDAEELYECTGEIEFKNGK